MLLAMVEDIRVDHREAGRPFAQHAHPGCSDAERQQRIAQETLEIYAPIAHRLGMGKVRGELEDLSFQLSGAGSVAEMQEIEIAARGERSSSSNEIAGHRGEDSAREKAFRRASRAASSAPIRCSRR